MGRNKREQRELTAEEQEQATKLMEKYVTLAKRVASRYYREHGLGDQSWGGFAFGDILGVANVGLCEAVHDYVEWHLCPKTLEKSYQVKEITLSESRERAYLAEAIENEIINYVRREDNKYTVKEQVERSGMVQVVKKPRFSTLKVHDGDDNGSTDCVDTATEAEFALVERIIDAYQAPDDTLRWFAETLQGKERAVFEELLKDASSEEAPRSPVEIAVACGISVRYFYMLQPTINRRFIAWHLSEYYGWAA
jgi:hypothetical protein